jgi:hypothetical protein
VGAAFSALVLHVLDAFLDAAPTDWVAVYAAQVKRSASTVDAEWQKHVAARDPQGRLTLPLKTFAGKLRDA